MSCRVGCVWGITQAPYPVQGWLLEPLFVWQQAKALAEVPAALSAKAEPVRLSG